MSKKPDSISAFNHCVAEHFAGPENAPKYELPEYKGATIKKWCIVRNGTEEGRSTVDVIFEDENGQKYIAMLTGRIVRTISNMIGEEG